MYGCGFTLLYERISIKNRKEVRYDEFMSHFFNPVPKKRGVSVSKRGASEIEIVDKLIMIT